VSNNKELGVYHEDKIQSSSASYSRVNDNTLMSNREQETQVVFWQRKKKFLDHIALIA